MELDKKTEPGGEEEEVDPMEIAERGQKAISMLEEEYNSVVAELEDDEDLRGFRDQYDKLFNALQDSYKNEQRLMVKCRSLQADIAANTAKVATAMKLTNNDTDTINALKQELEEAWQMVEGAHQKEQKTQQDMTYISLEIDKLNQEIDQGAKVSTEQEEKIEMMRREKEDLEKKRDDLNAQIMELRGQLTFALQTQDSLERQRNDADNRLNEMQREVQIQSSEVMREERRRERLEKEMKQLKEDVIKREAETKNLQGEHEKCIENIKKSEKTVKDQKIMIDHMSREMETIQSKLSKITTDHENELITIAKLSQENAEKMIELKNKESEVLALKNEAAKLSALHANFLKRLQVLEGQKGDVVQQRDQLREELTIAEKRIDLLKKQAEADRKAIEDAARERDMLNRNLLRATGATQKQANIVKLQDQTKLNLEAEINNFRLEALKQRKLIFQLEKERDRYIGEASDLTLKVTSLQESLRITQSQLYDSKKHIAETETKLKQQQNMFEAVRNDRNLYSKNLVEAQDEIAALKQKLKVMTHQIEQLKEDITTKEAQLMKEEFELQKREKEHESLKLDLQAYMRDLEVSRKNIEVKESENRKLMSIIEDAENERAKQEKEIEQLLNERDILGTQLVRRNDELALLYEKIKILQGTLHKGEAQYRQRLTDIRILKIEVKKLRREKALLGRSMKSLGDVKREVYRLQNDLTKERGRCMTLEEELKTPLNVHRWRKLEGEDPASYELLRKVQLLQKRLLAQNTIAIEREQRLQTAEKLFVELRRLLARHPGPEISIRLQQTQSALRERGKQMKSLVSELNMFETQASEYKYEIEKLTHELQDVKKKYFTQKRHEQRVKDQETKINALAATLPSIKSVSQLQTGPNKVTGGGFRLSTGGNSNAPPQNKA